MCAVKPDHLWEVLNCHPGQSGVGKMKADVIRLAVGLRVHNEIDMEMAGIQINGR